MKKLDIDLGENQRFANPNHAYFDLTLPLDKNIGIILLKACLVNTLEECFNERGNYTLFANERDLRVLEWEDSSKLEEILTTGNVLLKLMRYEEEERKEDLKTEASDS